jgi:hypothetical protein
MSPYFLSLHMAVVECVWADNTYAAGILCAVANEENT